jgi:hypothetical protein
MSRWGTELAACPYTTNIFECTPFEPQRFQPSNFVEFSFQVDSLVSYAMQAEPADSDWEAALFDRKLGRWAREFADVAERTRVIHYLNAFAIDINYAKQVDAFIRSFLAFKALKRGNQDWICEFFDHPIEGSDSALVRAMTRGDTLLLRDLIAICRGVNLSEGDGNMLCRFLRVYRIDTRESEEVLAFYDKWAKYPVSYRTENESMIAWAERYTYVNCNLGDGQTPLGSAFQLQERGVADWLRKLGARTNPISRAGVLAAVAAVDPEAASMIGELR